MGPGAENSKTSTQAIRVGTRNSFRANDFFGNQRFSLESFKKPIPSYSSLSSFATKRIKEKEIKLKSLIMAQIERWRHA